ncbi:hypothetical protein MMC13_004129 [Lambiella insularis]|nr:hypothetical protein [Lambiella insularis]
MSWEEPIYSFSHQQPPTPTRTPTSATFGQNVFQTPKAESSFYDPRVTWNTADPYAASPNLLKTPRPYVATTPLFNRPSTASGQNTPKLGQNIAAEIASHVHHLSSTPHSPLPQLETNRQLSASPNLRSGKRRRSDAEESVPSPTFGLALDTSSSMRSAGSMQTPPPTSTSASRRKAQQAQVAKLVQQSAAAGRRMSVPFFPKSGNGDSSETQPEASAQQFSTLQFSPDVFEFSLSGPATAPIFPQHKLFWEPKHDEGMNIDFSEDLANPFDTPRPPPLDPFVSAHDHTIATQGLASQSFLSYSAVGSKTSLSANPCSSFVQTSFVSTAGPIREHHASTRTGVNAVDPSLLFSSPGRSLQPLDTSMASTAPADEDLLQPYAYQIQEAKRERVFEGSTKPKRKRKPDSDSPAVKAALETLRGDDPGPHKVRRQVTDNVILRTNKDTRPAAALLFNESNGHESSGRRRSLAQLNRGKMNCGKHHGPQHRTALALTIDSSGRARTETRTIMNETRSGQTEENSMDLDGRSDSSDSETSTDNSTIAVATSQAPSFSFSMEGSRGSRGPRMGQFSQKPISHSSKSSYASIHTSSTYAENWHPTLNTNSTSIAPDTGFGQPRGLVVHDAVQAPRLYGHIDSPGTEDGASEVETNIEFDERDGSAQYELKKVLRDRQSARKPTLDSRSKPKHQSFSLHKKESISRHSKGTSSTHQKKTTSNFSGVSPTTISDPDLPTPSSAGGGSASGNIRCICHNTLNDGQMVSWYVLRPLKRGKRLTCWKFGM